MNCRHCGDKIGLIERWRYEHFCGKECKARFEEESARLSLELLTHRTGRQEKPQPARGKAAVAVSSTGAQAQAQAHEPEPGEAAFLAQTEPGTADALVHAVGFHNSPPLAAGRKDKGKGKDKDWPKFPEGGMPERIAVEHEARQQKRALHQSVGLLPPPLLDDYWWPELLAVFSPEASHGAECAGMEAAWAVPLPANERVVVARAQDLPGRSMLEWTALEAVTEVPPLLLAGANAYLRGTGMESLNDRLEQVEYETDGWRVTATDFESTVVEPDRPRLGVPLAPIEIRTSPYGEPYRMVSRSAAMPPAVPAPPQAPPYPQQQQAQPPTWGAMMRHTLESAAVQQQPPPYWGGAPAHQSSFAPAMSPPPPPPVTPAHPPGMLIGAAAFQAPIALGAGGVMIQLVPNPGGFLNVPPRGACAGGSDLIAEAAEPQQPPVNCLDPEQQFPPAAVSCAEAGLLALQEPVIQREAAGVGTLRYATPEPEQNAAAGSRPTGLPASVGRPQLERPDWQNATAAIEPADQPDALQAASPIRRGDPLELPLSRPVPAPPCHATASIAVRGFSQRSVVLQWVLQANAAREPRMPAAASRARLTAERAA